MASHASMPSTAPSASIEPPRRGRPPRHRSRDDGDTRALLLRSGLALLTEKGYSAVGVDEVLRLAGVPKGSFYHYFTGKEDFGRATVAAYAGYFAAKLDRWLLDDNLTPLARLAGFIGDAIGGMKRHGFRRGCLVGNLGQEMGSLPEPFRAELIAVLEDWQRRTAACLEAARHAGEIAGDSDCAMLAETFWIGWEGAVLRAKLERRARPLEVFAASFHRLLPPPAAPSPTPRRQTQT